MLLAGRLAPHHHGCHPGQRVDLVIVYASREPEHLRTSGVEPLRTISEAHHPLLHAPLQRSCTGHLVGDGFEELGRGVKLPLSHPLLKKRFDCAENLTVLEAQNQVDGSDAQKQVDEAQKQLDDIQQQVEDALNGQ